MARFTVAYSSLLLRLCEVDLLLLKAKKLEVIDPKLHHKEIQALGRSATVLLSAHLEGYIKELGELLLDSLVNKSVCKTQYRRANFQSM